MNSFNSMQRNINLGIKTSYIYTSMTSYYATGIPYPCGIRIDSTYNLYFARAITVGTTSPGYLSRLTTDGNKTLTNLPSGAPVSIPSFVGLGIDSNNNVYPTNYTLASSAVYKYTPGGTTINTYITSLPGSDAVAVDNSGNIFVSSYTGNMSLYPAGNTATGTPLITSSGSTSYRFAASGTTTASGLKGGQLDCLRINNNKLYVCDGTNGCVYYFGLPDILGNTGNAKMYKFAGTGTYGGAANIPANTGATASNLSDVYGLDFDKVGNAYITEWSGGATGGITGLGGMIKKVDSTTGYITTLVGASSAAYSVQPKIHKAGTKLIDLCIKNTNNYMYVTDTSNNCIWELT